MSDLTALYQDVILDHNRRPRNFGAPHGANRTAEGRNPLCGDELTLWLRIEDDVIADVGFVGRGCAISRASASLMTTEVKGRTREEAERIFRRFHDVVTRGSGAPLSAEAEKALGALRVLSGVARFPARVKCASLAWHTLRRALEDPRASDAPPVVTSESVEDGAGSS